MMLGLALISYYPRVLYLFITFFFFFINLAFFPSFINFFFFPPIIIIIMWKKFLKTHNLCIYFVSNEMR